MTMEQYFLLAGKSEKQCIYIYVFVQTVDEAKTVKRAVKVKLIPAVK